MAQNRRLPGKIKEAFQGLRKGKAPRRHLVRDAGEPYDKFRDLLSDIDKSRIGVLHPAIFDPDRANLQNGVGTGIQACGLKGPGL